jgi:hypothetical protein
MLSVGEKDYNEAVESKQERLDRYVERVFQICCPLILILFAFLRTVVEAFNAMDIEAPLDANTEMLLQSLVRRAVGPQADKDAAILSEAVALDELQDQNPVDGLHVTLETESTIYTIGTVCTVRVVAVGGAVSTYDWIALHALNSSSTAPISWQWYQPTLQFHFPTHGQYVLRYMRKVNGAHLCLVQSPMLLCGPVVALTVDTSVVGQWAVTWNTPIQGSEAVSSSAWIGL